MKPQTLAILALLLAGLGAFYFYLQRPEKIDQNQLYTQIVPKLDVNDIVEINASGPPSDSKGGHPLALVKKDGRWLVQKREKNEPYWVPAKENKVKRLVSSLSGLTGEKRASSKDLLATFSLDKDHAMIITLKKKEGGKISIEVGKRGPQWNSSFVKLPGSNNVYLCSQNLLSLFDIWSETPTGNPEPGPWTDKTIIAEGPGEVEGVSYSRGTLEWSLVAQAGDERSKNREGSPAEQKKAHDYQKFILNYNGESSPRTEEEARKILQSFLPLYADDVVNPASAADYGLGPGQQTGRLTIHLKGKGVKILHIGRVDEKSQKGWIRDDKGTIFEVASNIIKKIENPLEEDKKAQKPGDKHAQILGTGK